MKNGPKLIFLQIFEQFGKKCLFAKKRYAEILHVCSAVAKNVEKKVKLLNRIFIGSANVAPDCKSKSRSSLFLQLFGKNGKISSKFSSLEN